MADLKLGEPFGMDDDAISKIDWELALSRVAHDQRTDFIYAPHLAFIYARASTECIASLKAELKSGKFSPGVPITIEVPKPFRIAVKAKPKRLGPNYSRPGSILLPRDRLLYQALADQAAPFVRKYTDQKRAFSHQLSDNNDPSMFLSTRKCWGNLQKALRAYGENKSIRYVLKIDVANYFGTLNQHTLINLLGDSGYPKQFLSRLEAMMVRYTGERSSRAILQGMYPSDLFGNYYLAPIDRFLNDLKYASARYVDDIYIFLTKLDAAEQLLRELIPVLRSYDLSLNEAKSAIVPKSALFAEEPDLEALFSAAVDEIAEQADDVDFDSDYGFQSEWDDEAIEEEEEGDLELQATMHLFDSIDEYPGNEENIERFCLPLFAKASSEYAIIHVLAAFRKRPSMAQIYCAYLARFASVNEVRTVLRALLGDSAIADWQKMWIVAALAQDTEANDETTKSVFTLFSDARSHEALRAVSAVYVGRFGDHARRKALFASYPSVSNYVQAAIYYSSRSWPGTERSNAKAAWGGHGPLHNLLTSAMASTKA